MDLSFSLARNVEGGIDVEASVQNARAVVQQYKVKRETEEADIVVAVAMAFDEHPNSVQNRRAVVSAAISIMKTPPAAWTDMERRINAYLTENTDQQADPEKGISAEKPRTRLYGRKMGPRGGLFAWRHVPTGTNA